MSSDGLVVSLVNEWGLRATGHDESTWRLERYSEIGLIEQQEVPRSVWHAQEQLESLGYSTRSLE